MSNQNQTTYVNLTADGLGFINRMRWAEPRNGDAYLALSLNAFHGKDGKKQQLFEAIPKGGAVCGLLQELMDQYPELTEGYQGQGNVTATCGFTVAGLEARKPFQTRTGKEVYPIGCNLIRIKWIKVNGQYWYREPREEQQNEYSPNQHQNPNAIRPNDGYPGDDDNGDYYDRQTKPAPVSRQSQNGNRQAVPQRNGYQGNGNYPNQGKGTGQRHGQNSRQRQY